MNTDAATFSLKQAQYLLKPHIDTLPFKRLKDYLVRLDGGTQINGVQWQLRLWESATLVPGNVDTDWKAFSVVVSQSPKLNAPEIKGKPRRIELCDLIMVCPHNDSVLWYYQESNFFPEQESTYHYNGRSALTYMSDEVFSTIISHRPMVSKELWKQYIEWVDESMSARKSIIGQHERLKSVLIRQI